MLADDRDRTLIENIPFIAVTLQNERAIKGKAIYCLPVKSVQYLNNDDFYK